MRRLTEPDALAAIAEVAHNMLVGPLAANRHAATDQVEDPLGSQEQADLIAAAIAAALHRPLYELPPDEVLAGQVQGLSCKNWRFDLVRRGEHRAVRVVAPIQDVFHPDRISTTSRIVSITSSVAEAALQAVLDRGARSAGAVDGDWEACSEPTRAGAVP